MCGIFGGISIKDPETALRTMGGCLRHRGPDDHGFFYENGVALGHTRLSIIDLSTGQQPMISSDQQHVIVFNGEIYNFHEIRSDLIKKGHHFRTTSDTEVILVAYQEWGVDCLDRFNGMFAFALWDKIRKTLWLVRDRLGKKPLYLMQEPGSFYFASEAKALWRLPSFQGDYDSRAIDQYLTFRYVPGERTFHKGIKKLPAGHWLLLDEKAHLIQRKQWWTIPLTRDERTTRSIQSYREEFQQLFSSAVRLRMIADVPLGAFLSSGIDSVSIASEMAKVSRPTFFTIGFGDEADEIDAAGQIAKELGGEHHVLRMQEQDFDLLPAAVASMDEPYGDPIILPTYLLAKKAAERVKVVLTGDGADETLGGYVHHGYFKKMPDVIPGFLRWALSTGIKMAPVSLLDMAFHYPTGLGDAGKARLAQLLRNGNDSMKAYLYFAALFSNDEKARLYANDFRSALDRDPDDFSEDMRKHFSRRDVSVFDKVLQWDLRTWFPEQTLMKFDRLTMANSIEGRCPYADHRLVEFFLKLPLDVYKALCDNKNIVRKIYQSERQYLPRKKKPFYLPMHKGFAARLKKFEEEVLESTQSIQHRWFHPNVVRELYLEHDRSPLLRGKQIMNLVVLLYWLNNNRVAVKGES